MANDLLQRPDEDQDRAEQTPGADELESLYQREAIPENQRNVDSSAPSADKLEEIYDKPAREDKDRNTESPSAESNSKDSSGSLLNNLPSPAARLRAIPGLVKGIRNKKKAGLIGGGFAAFIVTIIIGIFSLLPLKLHSIIENIEDKALDGVEQMVENRVEGIVQQYIFKELMPEVRRCSRQRLNQVVRLSSCTFGPQYTSKGYASELFNTWRNSKFQQQFLTEFDLEYHPSRERTGKPYRLITKTGNYDLDGVELREVRELSRTDFSRQVRAFIKKNTKWYQVMQRAGLRRVAKSYAFRRFAVGDELNELRDRKDSRFAEARYRVKLTYARRVLAPISQNYSQVFICLINGCDFDAPELRNLRQGGNDSSQRLAKIVDEAIDPDIPGGTDRLLTRIIIKDLLEAMLEKTGSRLAGKISINAIPVAGQIISAVLIADGLDRSSDWVDKGGLEQAQRRISNLAFISHYSDAKSFIDESKAGEIRADELGAKVADYDGYADNNKVWNEMFAGQTNNIVYAAEPVICRDGEPLPANQLVCDEQTLSAKKDAVVALENYVGFVKQIYDLDDCGLAANPYADLTDEEIEEFQEDNGINLGPLRAFDPVGWVCENLREGAIDIVNTFFGWVGRGILNITEIDEWLFEYVERWLGGPIGEILAFMQNLFFYPGMFDNSTSLENFHGLAAGAISTGQAYTQGGIEDDGTAFGLGMAEISVEDYAKILDEAAEEERNVYANMSFMGRIKELAPKKGKQFAMSAVRGGESKPRIISNNFAALVDFGVSAPFNSVKYATSSPSAYADTSDIRVLAAYDHRFFGIPSDHEYYNADVEQYNEDDCKEIESEWVKSYDPVTDSFEGMNLCSAEREVARMLGTFYTNEDDSSL